MFTVHFQSYPYDDVHVSMDMIYGYLYNPFYIFFCEKSIIYSYCVLMMEYARMLGPQAPLSNVDRRKMMEYVIRGGNAPNRNAYVCINAILLKKLH